MILSDSIHGCDVAPKKGATIFDGEKKLFALTINEIAAYIADRPPRSLLSWDSPLTGPNDPDGTSLLNRDLTQRPIERFFNQKGAFKVPKGISVLPYSGCPHWTISQRFLGLPRIGRYSSTVEQLPLRPLFQQSDLESLATENRPFVVEVHPAVGMWLWCRKTHTRAKWRYKGDKRKRNVTVEALWSVMCICVPKARQLPTPEDDDELDALVAWLLADRWVAKDGVVLLGDSRLGSFLVPDVAHLQDEFESFNQKREKRLANARKRTKK